MVHGPTQQESRPTLLKGILEDAWDGLVGRVVPGAFFAVLFIIKGEHLLAFVRGASERKAVMGGPGFYGSLIYQGLLIGFLGLVVLLFIIRSEPIRKAEGIWSRLVSQSGAFILTVVAAMPQRPLGWGVDAAASVLLGGGMAITLVALVHLGRCFSIMPEVRGAVMSGPYRYVRHPMYLGEFVSGLGMVLASLSWMSAGIFLLFAWLQIQRMNYEERGLRNFFPRYDGYLLRTKRLIPWVY